MSVAAQPSRHADVALLRRSLARGGREVMLRETRGSTVFLAGANAYKLRKPIRIDFVDQRSLEARAAASQREVVLNAQLAPGIVLGVRAVVPSIARDHYVLEPAEDPRAIDHVVEMRRFDEARTMRALAARGALTAAEASAAGDRLARFHRSATRHRGGVGYRALVEHNLEALLALAEPLLQEREWLGLRRFAAAFLLDSASVLAARAMTGNVVDGHGDLRAQNLLFESGEVLIVNRLETDALRVVDIADELGFLVMELADLTGTRALGDAVLTGYVLAGGAPQPDALLAFFGTYRAQVHAKAALVRASRAGVDADAHAQQACARRLLALSRRLAWRARGPLLLLVTGPPAAGRSTLAQALGSVSGLAVLSSEAIRREHGNERAVDAVADHAAVDTELARRVCREPAAIVDATAGDAQLQGALAEQLADGGAADPLVIECRAPAQLAPDVAEPCVAIDGVSDDGRLSVDTSAPVATQVDEVESWLDALLAAGRIT